MFRLRRETDTGIRFDIDRNPLSITVIYTLINNKNEGQNT